VRRPYALARAALAVLGRGEVREIPLDAGRELVGLVGTHEAKARLPPRARAATTRVETEPLLQPRPFGARDQNHSDREQGGVQTAHAARLAERSGLTPIAAP